MGEATRMSMLIERVTRARAKLEAMNVPAVAVELNFTDSRRNDKEDVYLLGMRLYWTDGPERVLSAPEYGRFVELSDG